MMCHAASGHAVTSVYNRAGSVSVFGVGIDIRYFRQYFFTSVRYSVSVSVTDPGLVTIYSHVRYLL